MTILMKARALLRQEAAIGDVMQGRFESADASEMAETALARLHECSCRSLPVIRGDRLPGIVTAGNVAEFLMMQAGLWQRTG